MRRNPVPDLTWIEPVIDEPIHSLFLVAPGRGLERAERHLGFLWRAFHAEG